VKVLFVLEYHYPHVGGVETLFKDLTESLASRDYEVTVLTNQYHPGLAKEEALNGVKIHRVPYRNRYLFTLLAFFPAYRMARTHDLIHSTSYNAALPAYFAGLLARKRVLITFHEVWGRLWFKLPFMGFISKILHFSFEWLLLKLSFHRFIAVSESTKNRLLDSGVPPHKLKMIYNGLDYSQFNIDDVQKTSTMYSFIYFGRLGISKGLDILLEGAALCQSAGAEFELQMVIPSENSSFKNQILDLIKEYELEDSVIMHHDLERLALLSLIKAVDATIVPSYSEGFGFTAVESRALGIPVISSGMGSLKEVISGYYIHFQPYSGQGLASAMLEAISGEWQFLPEKNFKLEDSVQGYIDLYKDISANK